MRYTSSFNPRPTESLHRLFDFPRSGDCAIDNYVSPSIILNRQNDDQVMESLSVVPWISASDWHFNYTNAVDSGKNHAFRLPWTEIGRHVDFADFYTDDPKASVSSISVGKIPLGQSHTDIECFIRLTSYGRFRKHSKFY